MNRRHRLEGSTPRRGGLRIAEARGPYEPSGLLREDLARLVADGESETLELKRSTGELSSGMHSLCAMLNNRGGRVIFGVEDGGQVLGQPVSASTLEKVSAAIEEIDPTPLVQVDAIALDDSKSVVVVSVQRGAQRPYGYKGQSYRRVGSTTRKLTREQSEQMLVERLHGTLRWENEIAEGWSVDDLNEQEIRFTIEEAIRRGRTEDPGTRDPEAILRGLGLSKDGRLLRASAVLFAKPDRVLPDYPQCLLKVARFRGTDMTEFLDNRQFQGSAFSLLLQAERFLRDALPVAGQVVPGRLERVDLPLYPPVALREALANAFGHRDYSIGGGAVTIGVYDDRLEITSTGMLHFGITAEDLYRPHSSQPWNPLIAGVFYRRGVIDAWGRGTLKMVELTQAAGLPRPEFEEIAGAVLVRFRPGRYVVPQRVGHNLTARQQSILDILGSTSSLPLRDLEQLLPERVAKSTLRDDLTFLKRLGLVGNAGWAKTATWFLSGEPR